MICFIYVLFWVKEKVKQIGRLCLREEPVRRILDYK